MSDSQANPQDGGVEQKLGNVIGSLHKIEHVPESATSEEVLGSFLECLNSSQEPTKQLFDMLDSMFNKHMPEERRTKLAEISTDFRGLLVETMAFTPAARKVVQEKQQAGEFLLCVHTGLQQVADDDVDDDSKIPAQLVDMNNKAMQLLENADTGDSETSLLGNAGQLSTKYTRLSKNIHAEMRELTKLIDEEQARRKNYENWKKGMTVLAIAAALVAVAAGAYFAAPYAMSALTAGKGYVASMSANVSALDALKAAKFAAESTNKLWAFLSGKTAAVTAAKAAADVAGAAALEAGRNLAAIGVAFVGASAMSAGAGIAAHKSYEKSKGFQDALDELRQVEERARAIQSRCQSLDEGVQIASKAFRVVATLLRTSDQYQENIEARRGYWSMMKSSPAGRACQMLIKTQESLLERIDDLENITIKNYSDWVRAPAGYQLTFDVLQAMQVSATSGTSPPRQVVSQARQGASAVSKSEDDPEVHAAWKSMVIGASPKRLQPPTEPGGLDVGALSNETYCGAFMAYFDDETGNMVFMLVTRSSAAMDNHMPTRGIYKTQHLALTKWKLDELRGERKLGPEGKFHYVLGFAIDGKKLKKTSCANVSMNGERKLTDLQFDSIFQYLTAAGYGLERDE